MTDSVLSGYKERIQDILTSGRRLDVIHLAIIILGGILLALLANYDALWFDELFSVALASHSFSDIWIMGASDVHPVLYYWMLHGVYLVFGENIYAFRLVSIAGIFVLSLLGFTHIRKMFGNGAGILFSILAFLLPWCVHIAFQIRMYGWVAVAVMICAIYGFKIRACLSQNEGRIPLYWWLILSVSSIASAYLHYYGAMAAFCIQLLVIIAIVRHQANRMANMLAWLISAAFAVVVFLPWLFICVSQVAAVSQDFWITFSYPSTFAEIALFPFNAPDVVAFIYQEVETSSGTLIFIVLFLLVIILEIVCALSVGRIQSAPESSRHISRGVKAALAFFSSIYVGVIVIAALLSILIDQPILYYRYLSVALGPVVLVISLALVTVARKGTYHICTLCAAVIVVFAVVSYCSLYKTAYDPQNHEALEAYDRLSEEVQEANHGGESLAFTDYEELACMVAVSDEGLPIVCMNPEEKYKVFEPGFIVDDSWKDLLDNYSGQAIFIGTNKAAAEFAEKNGGTIMKGARYYYPYINIWLTYSIVSFPEVR